MSLQLLLPWIQKSLETAGKSIPAVLVPTLLFEEVASISAVNDTSSHCSSYSQNHITTKITAIILILLSDLIFKKAFDEERTV